MMKGFASHGRLIEPVLGARPPRPTYSYCLEGIPPKRPNPKLHTESTGAATDRLQHTFADRVYAACEAMTPAPLSHGLVSVNVESRYSGPLVATYKVVQDTLVDRVRALRRDDNSLRVPEFYAGRGLDVPHGVIVTLIDPTTGEFYSRELVAAAHPSRVPTDGAHSFRFHGAKTKDPLTYEAQVLERAAHITPCPASLPVGALTDEQLYRCDMTITVHGLDPKRDLDNCVLAVMDVIQAARLCESGDCTTVDRLVRSVHAVSLPGRARTCVDISHPHQYLDHPGISSPTG